MRPSGRGVARQLCDLLLRNHHRHGNNWALIGRKIGVSARAARDKYRSIASRQRTGRGVVTLHMCQSLFVCACVRKVVAR